MQVIIKKRLNQDVWLTQQNSSSSTDTSHSTSSHSELKFQKTPQHFCRAKDIYWQVQNCKNTFFTIFWNAKKSIFTQKRKIILYITVILLFFHITATSASPRASSTSPGRGGELEHQSSQQVQSQQSGSTPVQNIDQFETRNYVYDIVILIIAIVIGLLLYRRFTISMDVPTSPPDTAPEPGDLPWKKVIIVSILTFLISCDWPITERKNKKWNFLT